MRSSLLPIRSRRASSRSPSLIPSLVLSLVACGALSGCLANDSGRVAAMRTGEVLVPAAPRVAVGDARGACAEAVEPDPRLRRLPYLQSVTDEGALVLWTTTAAPGERIEVAVRSPDGVEHEVSAAEVEPTTHLEGATQMVARLKGLDAGATYCYTVRDADGSPMFGPHELETAPRANDPGKIELVAFGDSGGPTDDQRLLAEQMHTVASDLVLHMGDLAYMDGTLPELEAQVFDVYTPLLRSVPLFPTAGNHDYDTDGAAPFREVFALPEGSPTMPERWYSFDWGALHVVALDSQVQTQEQAEWLRQDLEDSELPWTIAIVHQGPHSSGSHGPNTKFRELFSPILVEHGVQLVLSGHDHHYERSEPIDGVTYVVTGGGGYSTRVPSENGEHTAFAHDVVHFLYVSIEGAVLRLHAIDATGREFDGAEIVLDS